MLARFNIPPTRSSLLRVQKTLEMANEGYDILEKKREVLATELIHAAHDAQKIEKDVNTLLTAAYRALDKAKMKMGRERVEWAALAINKTVEVNVKLRSVMGVMIPVIEAHGEPPEIAYGLGDTSVTLDDAAAHFRKVLEKIPALCEVVSTVWRLAWELQKTQRRVNALEYVFIPYYETIVERIQAVLEEREREEIFRLKRLKSNVLPTSEFKQGNIPSHQEIHDKATLSDQE
jgi:V/A-type H+-transporting ATPase subunit D